uniref:Uncharacterized protein n=2 Tax=Phocoena sinus TaxID=42100 RepID=A0A8C9DWT4_PHOSS
MGLAKHRPALFIEIKPGADPARVRQYPMPIEAKTGITPHIRRLLDLGILHPCQSAWNTPLLPVRKPNSKDYRPVQDLREVNRRVIDIHPTVPNPYTLLSALSPEKQWYTVLDLKDAFFSLPLAPKSQELFAFEWSDPERGINGQLTWTRLPQGFKNSPTLFDEALHEDLSEYRRQNPNITLLQYVDDLLIAAGTTEACLQGTRNLLQTLGTLGYRASAKKAQICRPEVTYLGYLLKGGQRWLTDARKETVLRIPRPTTPRQVREFLGSAGFCRLWIPKFAEMAKPLYLATKEQTPFEWTEEAEQSFQQIKTALLSAPALGLPDVSKPFHLFVDENKGIAKAVLTQPLGPWTRPIAYLSKKLDPVAAGWPPCLRVIAATALMVKDANKLTMGQELHVTTPHAIDGVLKQPPDRWMSNARLVHYQGLLLNPLKISYTPPRALNPASLLPDPDLDSPLHDCAEVLAQIHGVREDLCDQPLLDAQVIWFTDGSSFVQQGQRYAGAAVTSETEVIWAKTLSPGTSAQKAELIALTQALKMSKDQKATIYTDSRYAFATAHIHGAIYRERGLLTAEGKDIKNKEEILALLVAIWEPKKLAIVHCPGHQKPTNPVARGNNLADQTARKAAYTPIPLLPLQLPDPGPRELPPQPDYSEDDIRWINKLPLTQVKDGWWRDAKNNILLPEKLGTLVLERIHRSTHLGARRLQDLIRQTGLKIKNVSEKTERLVAGCAVCQLHNANTHPPTAGIRERGNQPGAYWEVDFTEVKPGKYGYRYLLVFIDTFSGWTEAFPTKNETAQIVAKKLLEEILPRYGFPVMIGSDNGPAFVSKVSQDLASILGADWKLHCAYRPQSSGQVERMNRTLKETLTKLTMETGANWVVLLPYALFRVRNSPYKLGFTPYEIIHGRPLPIIPNLKTNLIQSDPENNLLSSLQALQRIHETIWPKLKELYTTGPPPTPHQLRPGDWVLIKRHRQETLEPRWKGPYQIILTTPTAIKVDSIAAWIHYTHVKPVDPLSDLIKSTKADVTWTVDRSKDNPLKLTLRHTLPHEDQGTADSSNDSPNPQPSGHEGRIQPPPNKNALMQQLYGAPCECRGGTSETPVVPRRYTHMQDCGGITAYLVQVYGGTGVKTSWQCYHKPKPLPPRAICPCSTFQESMHSTCYSSYQQCIGTNNKTYFTATLQNNKSPTISDNNKYLQAGCIGTPGTPVCWNTRAPIHMSD